ncbi:MAG: metalloregulator ArsR/SmtB family transcription factor [Chromatiales bacterium]|nr:metalloregulator ArsR/SmtB family transcription factor [Chromatiales bacterium]
MNTSFHSQLYQQYARIGKAVSNDHRIALLDFLAQSERSVEELTRLSGLSVANTSQHLQILRQAGLVKSRKAGQHVIYRLSDDEGVLRLLEDLRTLAERHLEATRELVQSRAGDADMLVTLNAQELLTRARAGEVVVLDVRPRCEYETAHLPGAVNIPLEELENRFSELPADRAVVAYCRGRYCYLAHEAVARLRRRGYNAGRLPDGLPEWKLAGLPVEQRSSAA